MLQNVNESSHPGSNRGPHDLQSRALPLSYMSYGLMSYTLKNFIFIQEIDLHTLCHFILRICSICVVLRLHHQSTIHVIRK